MTGHEPATDDEDATTLSPTEPATYHHYASHPLSRGQAVRDIRELVTTTDPHEELGEAVVVDTHPPDSIDVHSETFERDGTEIPLAEYHLNRLYADFETSTRVVTIVWGSTLDGLAPQWRTHRDDPDAMLQYFDDLADNWDVALAAHARAYSYPESRLIATDDVPAEVQP